MMETKKPLGRAKKGPPFSWASRTTKQIVYEVDGFRFVTVWHLTTMQPDRSIAGYSFRIPSEPSPPPIQDPIDPPENPDVPVREPDPEDPGQI
jgi:hypothetical protein